MLRIVYSVNSKKVPFDRRRLRKVLREIFADHGRGAGLLSVAVVNDARIHEVNREFLGHDYPTDVVSFLLDDTVGDADGAESEDEAFGELVVSADTASREAERRGLSPERELALYVIHGALHLVGYDDQTPGERRKMRSQEKRYLAFFEDLIQPPPRRTSSS